MAWLMNRGTRALGAALLVFASINLTSLQSAAQGPVEEGSPLQHMTPEQQQRIKELTAQSLASRSTEWRCDVKLLTVCGNGRCEQGNIPPAWFLIDFKTNVYERCNERSCQKFTVQNTVNGPFTTLFVANRPLFLRLVNDGSAFIEVSSAGITSVNAFGSCKPGR